METLIHHCMPGKGCLIMVPVGTPWEKVDHMNSVKPSVIYFWLMGYFIQFHQVDVINIHTKTSGHQTRVCNTDGEKLESFHHVFKKKHQKNLWSYIFHTCRLTKLDSWISCIIHKYYNIGCSRFLGIKLDVDTAVAITMPWWEELMKYSGIWMVFKSSNVI